jgi:hypothetical protein
MAAFVEQLEYMGCSPSRNSTLHGEPIYRIVGQTEAARNAGSAPLIRSRYGSRIIPNRADVLLDSVTGRLSLGEVSNVEVTVELIHVCAKDLSLNRQWSMAARSAEGRDVSPAREGDQQPWWG